MKNNATLTSLKINKVQLVELFGAMGALSAAKWNNKKLAEKAVALVDMELDEFELNDEQQKLVMEIMEAVKAGVELCIVGNDVPAKKAKKAKPAPVELPEPEPELPAVVEEPAAVEPEPEPVDEKPAVTEQPAKSPPVIKSIIAILQAASERKPLTKEKVLEQLVLRIPNRPATSMAKTITAQIGYHLPSKGYSIGKNENGYWLAAAPKN